MAQFIELYDNYSKPILINLEWIAYIKPYDEKTTYIHIGCPNMNGNNHMFSESVLVKGSYAAIKSKIYYGYE
jgi:hypothetical protein